MPSFGSANSSLKIDSEERETNGTTYKIPILVNSVIPFNLGTDTNSSRVNEFIIPSSLISKNIIQPSNLTIIVEPPLTFQKLVNNFWNTWAGGYIWLFGIVGSYMLLIKRFDIRKVLLSIDIKSTDIIQIDATVIVGVLILLTLATTDQGSSEGFNRSTVTLLTANIVFTFAISAIVVLLKGSINYGAKLMVG